MSNAPPGLIARADDICAGRVRADVREIDQLLRDLHGFDDGAAYIDYLLDYRNLRMAEEVFRPGTGG